MINRTPSLTERQLSLITRAAAALPIDRRDEFRRSVMMRLTGEPMTSAVMQVVNDVMSAIPVEE